MTTADVDMARRLHAVEALAAQNAARLDRIATALGIAGGMLATSLPCRGPEEVRSKVSGG